MYVLCVDVLHLHLGHLSDAFIQSDLQIIHLSEEGETIHRCQYSKDVDRTKCKALPIARLTQSPYTTKLARIRLVDRCLQCNIRTNRDSD